MEDFNLFELMSRAEHIYARLMEPLCKQWKLTRNELDVLLFLANHPTLDRAADVAVNRGIAKSHVSLSVSTLEARGFLQRTFDPNDRRSAHLKLMGDALTVAEAGRAIQNEYFHGLFRDMEREELEKMVEIFKKIAENARDLDKK